MNIYKNVRFARFARKEGISDAVLCDAVGRAMRGLVDADLGGGVIKQRVSRLGEGRSGGYRTILFFRLGVRAFFIHDFAKKDRDNIDLDELKALREAAPVLLGANVAVIDAMLTNGQLFEVDCHGQTVPH